MINFGEKKTERVNGVDVPVVQLPQYRAAKEKAIEIIESGKYGLDEADFWILQNKSRDGKQMYYSGLIAKHNACLKINDHLESKFDPTCVDLDKDGFNGSLVYTYSNKDQGVYEVGEVSAKNCKNDYPYAMAFKRLYDRVILKLCKLAYSGIYSEVESDEFKQPDVEATPSDDFFAAKPKKTKEERELDKIKDSLHVTALNLKIDSLVTDDLAKTYKELVNYGKTADLSDADKNNLRYAVKALGDYLKQCKGA